MPPADKVHTLKALIAHRRAYDYLPKPFVLYEILSGRLERTGIDARELILKQRTLKHRYDHDSKMSSLRSMNTSVAFTSSLGKSGPTTCPLIASAYVKYNKKLDGSKNDGNRCS